MQVDKAMCQILNGIYIPLNILKLGGGEEKKTYFKMLIFIIC